MIALLGPDDWVKLAWVWEQRNFQFNWSQEAIASQLQSGEVWGLLGRDRVEAALGVKRLGSVLEVLWLTTHPLCRRQGKMGTLLSEVINAAQDASEIWLEVHEENQGALLFYQGLGFETVGFRPGYYPDQRGAVLMNLRRGRQM